MDAFKGQYTDGVKKKLHSLSIKMVQVPANMTHFFQPLDLKVNRVAKQHTEISFVKYYSDCVAKQLKSGNDIEVDLRLTVVKPLQVQWLVDMYNYFSTAPGKEAILKGWKKAEILGILDGTVELLPENPFQAIYEK